MKEPRSDGASRDPFLRSNATREDYNAYCRWCRARGIRPLKREPLAYGDAPPVSEAELAALKRMAGLSTHAGEQ